MFCVFRSGWPCASLSVYTLPFIVGTAVPLVIPKIGPLPDYIYCRCRIVVTAAELSIFASVFVALVCLPNVQSR